MSRPTDRGAGKGAHIARASGQGRGAQPAAAVDQGRRLQEIPQGQRGQHQAADGLVNHRAQDFVPGGWFPNILLIWVARAFSRCRSLWLGQVRGAGIRGARLRASLWKKLARGAVLALGRDVAVGRRGKPATPCAIRRNFSTRVLDACNLPLGLRFGGTDATPLAALAFQNSALPFVVAGVPIARNACSPRPASVSRSAATPRSACPIRASSRAT